MKKTILIATALAAGMAANADKLYLSGIECINHTFPNSSDFSFKSLFQYDDNDDIMQIETNQSIDEKSISPTFTDLQPASFLFKYEYNQDKILSVVNYSDSDGKTAVASDFQEEMSDEIRTITTSVSGTNPTIDYTLTAEYNADNELIAEKRITDANTVISKYSYSYNDNSQPIRVEYFDGDDQLMGYWKLQYGENGELTQCDYYRIEIDDSQTYDIHCTRHVFTYFETGPENNIQMIAPQPSTIVYAIRDINPAMDEIFTFQIPECAARILTKQNDYRLKNIQQWLHYGMINNADDSHDLVGTASYTFELKYQTERPTAGVAEVMMPADANPEYYNLQGQKVAAPEEGSIYIVKRGAKASKEVYRQ